MRPKALRIASAKLRLELRTAHPFATSLVYVVADRADVFVQTMREAAVSAEDGVLRSLTTDNFVLRGIVERGLVPGLYFGDTTLASRWEPRPQAFPGIFINPLVAYGQPALESGLPTASIRAQWEAEGEDYDAAAYWLEVKTSDVRRAVEFENLLDRQCREVATA